MNKIGKEKLLLTKEENKESPINTIIRQKTRTKFEPKIGQIWSHPTDTNTKM